MNFMPAQIERDAATAAQLDDGGVFRGLPAGLAAAAVTIGVRPEDFRLVANAERHGDMRLSGRLLIIEPLGGESLLTVICGRNEIVCKTSGIPAFAGGEELSLAVAPEAVHIFDRTTGGRLA